MRAALVLSILLAARAIFAQAFYFDAFDARALGMAGATFGGDGGPSSTAFDPAMSALRPGLHLSMGGMLGIRSSSFTDTRPAPPSDPYRPAPVFETNNGAEAFPLCSFSYAPQRVPVGFGLSVFEPFQFYTEWPNTWFGATPQVSQVNANAVYSSASIGYRFNKYVAVGAALHVVSGTLRLMRIGNPGDLPSATVSSVDEARGNGAAVSLSMIVRPSAQFSVAFGYTSGANMTMKGSTTAVQSFATEQQGMHTTMSLPTMLNLALSFRPTALVTIDASVTHLGWSGFDGWQFKYDDSTAFGGARSVPFNFSNAIVVRAGLEVVLRSVSLRAGFGYASSPVNPDSASLLYPDAGAFLYSAGLGYAFTRNIRLDFGYRGRAFASRSATVSGVPGTFANAQHELAASVALTFEPRTPSKNNPLSASR